LHSPPNAQAIFRVLDVVNKEQTPFRLVNRTGVSIHHVASNAAIWRSAFIFDERGAAAVNRSLARRRAMPRDSSGCELRVKSLLPTKTRE
jgi:hypothetical protein